MPLLRAVRVSIVESRTAAQRRARRVMGRCAAHVVRERRLASLVTGGRVLVLCVQCEDD